MAVLSSRHRSCLGVNREGNTDEDEDADGDDAVSPARLRATGDLNWTPDDSVTATPLPP